MSLTEEEASFYRQSLEMSKRQLEDTDRAIENELAQVKERLAELHNKRKAALQMYDAACTMLGIENDLEDKTEEDRVSEA